MDNAGPIKTAYGKYYVVLIMDDYSRYLHTIVTYMHCVLRSWCVATINHNPEYNLTSFYTTRIYISYLPYWIAYLQALNFSRLAIVLVWQRRGDIKALLIALLNDILRIKINSCLTLFINLLIFT